MTELTQEKLREITESACEGYVSVSGIHALLDHIATLTAERDRLREALTVIRKSAADETNVCIICGGCMLGCDREPSCDCFAALAPAPPIDAATDRIAEK